jgi:phage terminase small subunit
MSTLPSYELDAHLGPAMRALTPLQQQFVMALIQSGCSQTKAAELAGYKGGPDVWKVRGYELAHDPRVQRAMHEEALKRIRSTAPMAIRVLETLAGNAKVKPETRLKAATELLNRSGLHPTSEHIVTVDRPEMDQRELVRRIAALAKEQGLDPIKLLGSRGVVIDAEFEIVEPAASSAGLEDLL